MSASCSTGELHYQWYRYEDGYGDRPVSGATAATYTTDPITGYTEYWCDVRDDYGTSRRVYFYVYVDNQLTVDAVGDTTRYVALNATETLEVSASCSTGELHYQWYRDGDIINGATGATYTTEAITKYTQYYCDVSDDYGASRRVYFYVYIDNQLTANVVGVTDRYVALNATETLEVSASCNTGGLHYQWYRYEDGYGDITIEGATGATYTTEPITGYTDYRCYVSDDYGASCRVDFRVYVDNELTANAVGDTERYVAVNATETLEVNASCSTGELHYQWYRYEDGYGDRPVSGATAATYTTDPITGYTEYYCIVTDDYGGSRDVWFDLHVQDN